MCMSASSYGAKVVDFPVCPLPYFYPLTHLIHRDGLRQRIQGVSEGNRDKFFSFPFSTYHVRFVAEDMQHFYLGLITLYEYEVR